MVSQLVQLLVLNGGKHLFKEKKLIESFVLVNLILHLLLFFSFLLLILLHLLLPSQFTDGSSPKPGEIFTNPDLGQTFREVALKGAVEGFYRGENLCYSNN